MGVASDVDLQGAEAFDTKEHQFTCLTYEESKDALKQHMPSLCAKGH